MRPEKLEFYGVKSYIDKVTIDFDRLLKSGLFGVFGTTGSGKSTILDCIFLALYGKLPKSSDREDYINVKVGKCAVNFIFSVLDGSERKFYEVNREFQLKGERKTAPNPVAKLYEIIGNDKKSMEDNTNRVNDKLREIIGLSIDDFEKCIVLPQGQFSAFVTLPRAARFDMISGLFDLDKYGEKLSDKLKYNLVELKDELLIKTTSIAQYEEATEDSIKKLNQDLETAKFEYDNENVKLAKMQEEFNDYKKFYELRNQLDAAKKNYQKLESNYTFMERKKQLLAKIEFAKSFVDHDNELKTLNKRIAFSEDRINSLKKVEGATIKELNDVEAKLQTADNMRDEVSKISETLAVLNLLLDDKKELLSYENKLLELRKDYSEILNEYNDVKSKIQSKQNDKESFKLQPKYASLEQKIQNGLSKLIKASQSDFVKDEIEFLSSLSLDGEINCKVKSRIEELAVSLNASDSVEEAVKTLNCLYEVLDEYREVLERFNEEIATLELSEKELSLKLDSVKEQGNETRISYDKLNAKLLTATNGEVLEDKIARLIKQKASIENLLNSLQKQKEDKTLYLSEVRSKILSETTALTFSKENALDVQSKIANDLLNFDGVNEALEVYVLYKDRANLTREVDEFFASFYGAKEVVQSLEKKMGDRIVSDEEYAEKLEYLKILKENRDNLHISYNYLLNSSEILSQNFKKRCKIEREISALTRERNVVSELFDAVKGKKFLGYVAEEYLSEIALDAKSILMELTGGRFGLIYSGEFYVEDYIYSSGERRKVDAVSGGELFLVSLSLALSLSKSIYSKSLRPMEFFFLDEGFGSLDKDLVETVVDCLYKLKNSNFSIGIISHVDALKERLPIRINVSGATAEKGSAISVTA